MDPHLAAGAGQEDAAAAEEHDHHHQEERVFSSAGPTSHAGSKRARTSTPSSYYSTDDSGDSVNSRRYNPALAQEELARFVVAHGLPVRLGETPSFQSLIRRGFFCPQYEPVTRDAARSEILASFREQADEIKEAFSKLSFSSFALTCDVWTTLYHDTDCLSVAAHYLDDDNTLHKRVLGFKPIRGGEHSHRGEAIAEHIRGVIKEYGLENRIAGVTLDSTLASTNVMQMLNPVVESHFGGYVLYQRCICDVINGIVREGMAEMAAPLGNIRSAIVHISTSDVCAAEFGKYCRAQGKQPRRFVLDTKVSWASTYLMLKEVLPYKCILTSFVNDRTKTESLSDTDWSLAEKFYEFLEVFYESTKCLSGVYNHTSPLVLHQLGDIAVLVQTHRMDPGFGKIARATEQQLLKCFETIPHLYCFAFIVDPRIKFDRLRVALDFLDQALNTDHSSSYSRITDEFSRVFASYYAKFGKTYRDQFLPRSEYGHIYRDSARRMRERLGMPSPTPPTPQAMAQGELDRYLSVDHRSDPEFVDHDNVNLLLFWKNKRRCYPVLSQLAREILTVPASTVCSESAFSLEGRTVQDRRVGLAPGMVEAIACLKDWQNAAAREQHSVEDVEFATELEALNLDSE